MLKTGLSEVKMEGFVIWTAPGRPCERFHGEARRAQSIGAMPASASTPATRRRPRLGHGPQAANLRLGAVAQQQAPTTAAQRRTSGAPWPTGAVCISHVGRRSGSQTVARSDWNGWRARGPGPERASHGGVGHQRRANHGLRGATRPWHRFGRLPGTDSASQALRCPPDTAALSGGFPAGPHERPHLPTAPPDTWASGNYVSTSPPNACWIPATTRAMAASSLAATFSVTTARPLPSRRQWPTVFDPHRITNTSS